MVTEKAEDLECGSEATAFEAATKAGGEWRWITFAQVKQVAHDSNSIAAQKR